MWGSTNSRSVSVLFIEDFFGASEHLWLPTVSASFDAGVVQEQGGYFGGQQSVFGAPRTEKISVDKLASEAAIDVNVKFAAASKAMATWSVDDVCAFLEANDLQALTEGARAEQLNGLSMDTLINTMTHSFGSSARAFHKLTEMMFPKATFGQRERLRQKMVMLKGLGIDQLDGALEDTSSSSSSTTSSASSGSSSTKTGDYPWSRTFCVSLLVPSSIAALSLFGKRESKFPLVSLVRYQRSSANTGNVFGQTDNFQMTEIMDGKATLVRQIDLRHAILTDVMQSPQSYGTEDINWRFVFRGLTMLVHEPQNGTASSYEADIKFLQRLLAADSREDFFSRFSFHKTGLTLVLRKKPASVAELLLETRAKAKSSSSAPSFDTPSNFRGASGSSSTKFNDNGKKRLTASDAVEEKETQNSTATQRVRLKRYEKQKKIAHRVAVESVIILMSCHCSAFENRNDARLQRLREAKWNSGEDKTS
jgi:hypothetical protein